MNRARSRCRSVLLFLGAVGVIFSNALPAAGSLLRDIRIGEYESSTRIVLEFDSEPRLISPPKIENGVLTVTLAGTHPKLVRRIPFENTSRISNLEIITHRDDKLEIRLLFSPRHGRLKWFNLQNPFRVGIDVELVDKQTESMPAASAAADDMPEPAATQIADEYAAFSTDTGQSTEHNQPDREDNLPQALSLRSQNASRPEGENVLPVVKTTASVDNESVNEQPGPQKAPAPKMPVLANPSRPVEPPPPKGRDLQLYLVGGLVLLTVIILGLLASIIFSRNRGSAGRGRLAIDELLRKQEKRLKTINAQIDEEMEKFDKI